jgi:hypothetical protein
MIRAGDSALKAIYGSEGEVMASREVFSRSLDEIKVWYENTPGIETPYLTVGAVQPFLLTYQHYNNRDLLRKYGYLSLIEAVGGADDRGVLPLVPPPV